MWPGEQSSGGGTGCGGSRWWWELGFCLLPPPHLHGAPHATGFLNTSKLGFTLPGGSGRQLGELLKAKLFGKFHFSIL